MLGVSDARSATPDKVHDYFVTQGYTGTLDDMWAQHLAAIGVTDTSEPFTTSLAGGASDPNWANVTALLNFEGEDAATTTTDESGSAQTITAFRGNAQISTAASKFGSSSLRVTTDGDLVEMADADDLSFAGEDFTVECFLNWSATSSGQEMFVAKYFNVGNQREWWLGTDGDASDIYFAYSTDGANGLVGPVAPFPSKNTGQWYHFAATREGNNWRIFVDGVLLNTAVITSSIFSGSSPVFIGGRYTNGYGLAPNAWIDSVRITKGVARYTENFTVPTETFPTS